MTTSDSFTTIPSRRVRCNRRLAASVCECDVHAFESSNSQFSYSDTICRMKFGQWYWFDCIMTWSMCWIRRCCSPKMHLIPYDHNTMMTKVIAQCNTKQNDEIDCAVLLQALITRDASEKKPSNRNLAKLVLWLFTGINAPNNISLHPSVRGQLMGKFPRDFYDGHKNARIDFNSSE